MMLPAQFGLRGLGASNPAIADMIRQTALTYGVDPNLAVTVARHESSLRQEAISPKGAIGVFQLMPATAAGLGVDPYDLTQNIQGGVSYLAQLLRQYNGDTSAALAAYNEGPGTYSRGVIYPETQRYVDSILSDAGYSQSHPTFVGPVQPTPDPASDATSYFLPTPPESQGSQGSSQSQSSSDPLLAVLLTAAAGVAIWSLT